MDKMSQVLDKLMTFRTERIEFIRGIIIILIILRLFIIINQRLLTNN